MQVGVAPRPLLGERSSAFNGALSNRCSRGWIGSTLAKLWVEAGHEVRLSSRHPDTLQPLVGELGNRASAGTAAEAATFGDVVLLAVPLKAVPELAPTLTEKVVATSTRISAPPLDQFSSLAALAGNTR